MIVFGGAPALYGIPSGVWAAGRPDCGDMTKYDVGLVLDVGFTATEYANLALWVLGLAAGLDTSSQQGDCMCSPPACSPSSTPCAFSANSPVQMMLCSTGGVQDEPALLTAAYDCP